VLASQRTVDLNADLGEGFGVCRLGDQEMLRLVTSANIACGFHAGDPAGPAPTCGAAAARDVRIGAQMGYRDLVGFGRRYIDITAEDLTADAVVALGRLGRAADNALAPTSDNLHTNLELLQPALRELGKASPYLIGALKLLLTAPFNIDNVPKVVRGDYINVSILADLTLSAIDNGQLSGTGVSGMLRALEQPWGRDPATMIPDVRFTPNLHDAPNGPLVERGG